MYHPSTDGHQEERLFKIGDFSRIAHVSVKTLRHYAHEELLEPVWIDRFSGYRYYSLEQLPKLNRILALKDMGFTLEQIKQMLNNKLTVDELREMLNTKRQDLMQHLQEEQQRLSRVQKRIEQMEKEGFTVSRDVLIKPIIGSQVAWSRTRAATIDQTEAAREGLRGLISHWCTLNRIRIVGPWFSLTSNNGYSETNVDIHLGVYVESDVQLKGDTLRSPVRLAQLPSMPMAACLLGDTSGYVPQAELLDWIMANGFQINGDIRLIYLGETAETPLSEGIVEIQIPVSRTMRTNLQTDDEKGQKMEPVKFENLPACKIMGMKYRGKNEKQEISALWESLNHRAGEIPMIDRSAYGVCLMIGDAPQGVFEYIAGFKVRDDAVPLDGMVMVDVPANRYAVFEYRGPVELLGKAYSDIVNVWFPRSGLQPTGGYDMEIYDEKFKGFEPGSVFYIYEPVR